VKGVFFDVTVADRPDGRSVQMTLFYSSPNGLTPGEYINLKNFLVEADRLYRISSHDIPKDPV